MLQRSPRAGPLLPTAASPQSPGVRQAALLAHRQRVRRVLLVGLVAFALINAAWGTHALVRAWRGRGSKREQASGSATTTAAATAGNLSADSARKQAASAADNAVMATMDAAAALSSAAGAVKHGAQAAGQAAGAALTAAAPMAARATGAAAKAAAAVGSTATAVGSKAAQAAAGLLGNSTAADLMKRTMQGGQGPLSGVGRPRSQQTGSSAGGSGGSLAELTPPEMAPTSNDTCAQVPRMGRRDCPAYSCATPS